METFGNNLGAKKGQKGQLLFECDICDFKCCKKYGFDRHLNTLKHMTNADMETFGNNLGAKKGQKGQQLTKLYYCELCDKEFQNRSGIWKHKKKCCNSNSNSNCNSNNDTIVNESNDNSFSDKELINILVNQNEKLMNLLEKGINTNNTNCNNTINKTFNLQVYLNETCKNAMNITDFISSINIDLEDLENTGRRGYIEGISNIFFKNLNNLEQHMRPIHCSDYKREILYIKDNNKWEKESNERPILTKAIKTIANQNIKQINSWKNKYPDCTESDSKKNNMYLKIVSNSMNGITEEESRKNIEKIISNVAKEVIIDKN
jgi:hypothetical protein